MNEQSLARVLAGVVTGSSVATGASPGSCAGADRPRQRGRRWSPAADRSAASVVMQMVTEETMIIVMEDTLT
jgi:hypothetical protein